MQGAGGQRSEARAARRLILASASPRRKELLGLICSEFEIRPSDYDESLISTELPPVEYVVLSASRKAQAVAAGIDCGIVIGADTIVVVDGEILGKPMDADDARRMLSRISGRKHQVYTGLSVLSVQAASMTEKTGVECTDVFVRPMTAEIMNKYISTGEPMDKAGAYAIQGKGSVLIEKINGCYFNVVGLPVYLVSRLLEEFGVEALSCRQRRSG